MGPKKKRPARIGQSGDYATVRRLLAAAEPNLQELREALDRIAASPNRLRYAEGVVYLNGCARYRELSGEDYGPRWGNY